MGRGPEDATGPGRNTLDTFVIGISGVHCKTIDDFHELDLPQEIASKIKAVMSGDQCPPVFLPPTIDPNDPNCAGQTVYNADSHVGFDGTLFLMEGNRHSLAEGEMLYKAFEDVCSKYPAAESIMALGIQIQPTGKDGESAIQARIERGDGQDLLRIHIWTGGAHLEIDGGTFLDLSTGMQALVDANLNVIEAFQIGKPPKDEPNIAEPQESSYVGTPGGCESTGSHNDVPPDTLTPLFTLVLALWIGAQIRQKLGTKVNIGELTTGLFTNIAKLTKKP